MFFFFIIGTRFLTWGSESGPQQMRCSQCGVVGNFVRKKGMNFITLFFVVPVIPISGVKQLWQCPNCRTRYNAE
ncbi:MAG TPA: hypothetical protein VF666_19245 [Pyrinomonadaceae bacterium]|jgi:hypothetical protein